MYAIIESGGKQVCVKKGDLVKVEKLDLNKDDEYEFPVLLVSGDGRTLVGTPHVEGAVVKGKVVEQGKARKVIVFHYRPKDNYRKKAGHRQPYTKFEITEVTAPGMGSEAGDAKKAEAAPAAEPAEAKEA